MGGKRLIGATYLVAPGVTSGAEALNEGGAERFSETPEFGNSEPGIGSPRLFGIAVPVDDGR